MRPIDADAFKKYIDCGHLRRPTEPVFSEIDIIRMIDKQPTVYAAKVMHGMWLEKEMSSSMMTVWECSQCGFRRDGVTSSYCPRCGSRMDGDRE